MALDYAVSASAWPKPRWERPDISRDAAVQRDIRDLQHDEGTDPLSDAPGYLGALMGYGKLRREHGGRVGIRRPAHHGAEALQVVPDAGVHGAMAERHGDVLDGRARLERYGCPRVPEACHRHPRQAMPPAEAPEAPSHLVRREVPAHAPGLPAPADGAQARERPPGEFQSTV